MSELKVNQLDVGVLNVATLLADTVNAASITASGNVTAGRVIVTGPSSYQFIERIPLAGVQMANTVNISGYSSLKWTIEGLIPANTNTSGGPKPWLQVSTDGGNLYANVNNFAFHTTSANANNVSDIGSNSHDDQLGRYILTYWGLDNVASTGGGSGIMYIHGNKAGVITRIQSNFDYRSGENDNGSPWNYQDRGFGRILQPNKITNYRLRLTEGSLISNGTITIEGIPG